MPITLTSEITVRLNRVAAGDDWIAASAKASTEGAAAVERVGSDDAAGLIGYMMRHRHGSPFEEGYLSLSVHAPAFVWWQWVRHRVQSFSLESARYRVLEPVFYVPPPERPMMLVDGHKPSKPKFEPATEHMHGAIIAAHRAVFKRAWDEYSYMLSRGIASEVARDVLPFSIYYSGWVRMNPRSCMSFLSLRVYDPDAKYPSYVQYETERAAAQVEAIFAEHWPLTHAAFVAHGRVAP